MRVLAVVGCAVLGSGVMALPRPSAAWGQTVSSATVTEVLDSDQLFIQNRRAAVNSVAQRQQRVRTQMARASLRFNNGAVARLAHNSSLMVGQCAQVTQGTLLVNGTLNGCSTTTVAGVRGTLYTLEVTEAGETIIQVFEGEVMVGQRTDDPGPAPKASQPKQGIPFPAKPSSPGLPSPPPPSDGSTEPIDESAEGQPDLSPTPPDAIPPETAETSETVDFNPDTVLVIEEGQQVTVNAESDEATISILTAEDFLALLEGPLIQGFSVDLPGISDLQSVFRRLFPNLPMIPTVPGVPPLVIPPPTSPSQPTSPGPYFPFPF